MATYAKAPAAVYGYEDACLAPCTVTFAAQARDVGYGDEYVYPPDYFARMQWDFDMGNDFAAFQPDAEGFQPTYTYTTPGTYSPGVRGTFFDGVVDETYGQSVRVIDRSDVLVFPELLSGTTLDLPKDLEFAAPTSALEVRWEAPGGIPYGFLDDLGRTGPDSRGYFHFRKRFPAAPVGSVTLMASPGRDAVGRRVVEAKFPVSVRSNAGPPLSAFALIKLRPIVSKTQCTVGKALTLMALERHKVRYALAVEYKVQGGAWKTLRTAKKALAGGFGKQYYPLSVIFGRKGGLVRQLVKEKAQVRLRGSVEVFRGSKTRVFRRALGGALKLGSSCQIGKT